MTDDYGMDRHFGAGEFVRRYLMWCEDIDNEQYYALMTLWGEAAWGMTLETIISVRARLQPWSSVDETQWLAAEMAERRIPFCADCGDWHLSADDHSEVSA